MEIAISSELRSTQIKSVEANRKTGTGSFLSASCML
jgi:hypothetical protein